MIVIKKVVLANGLHICAKALPYLHIELLKGDTLPLGCGLHYLGIDRILVIIVWNMKLDRSTRTITVQEVVHTTVNIYNQGNLNHHQIEFFAQILLEIIFYRKDSLLCFPWG